VLFIMAESNATTEIPAIPEPLATSVRLYDLAAEMMAGELRDALMAAQDQLTAYAALRSAVQHVIIDADAGELRTPTDIVRELRRALDVERMKGG
jgi:hypothetical protein